MMKAESSNEERSILCCVDPNTLKSDRINKAALKVKGSTDSSNLSIATVTKNYFSKPIGHDLSKPDKALEDKLNDFLTVCNYRIGEEDLKDNDTDVKFWSVDDFELISTLGSGGTANVYCAEERTSGFYVALKVLNYGEDSICEIDAHQSLDHPHVVKMYDYFFSDKHFCPGLVESLIDTSSSDKQPIEAWTTPHRKYVILILELCNQGSVFDFIRNQRNGFIDEKAAAKYFKQAIEAMEYVHAQELIHCDCKTLNYLVHDDDLKLADFGMSVHIDEKEVVGGSPVYMSPEHLVAWRHFTDDFDQRSDVYSLGVVLYEMLAGFLPYEIVEDDESAVDILVFGLNNLTIEGHAVQLPILDLRKLDDESSDETIYIPPPVFPGHFSKEACALISSLMEPSPENRISLSEAKNHIWFQAV